MFLNRSQFLLALNTKFGISWKDRRANETRAMKEQVEDLAGVQKPLIQIAQERKLKFFGHVTRHPSELRLANIIMHAVEGVAGCEEAG